MYIFVTFEMLCSILYMMHNSYETLPSGVYIDVNSKALCLLPTAPVHGTHSIQQSLLGGVGTQLRFSAWADTFPNNEALVP